jgi:hypothetical protein
MWLDKIRESMLSKKTNSSSRSSSKSSSKSSSSSSVDFDRELPKLNFDYRLNLDLYSIDKLIIEIFTDLKSDGFIADYHM